jgi:HlyD family secretion protein
MSAAPNASSVTLPAPKPERPSSVAHPQPPRRRRGLFIAGALLLAAALGYAFWPKASTPAPAAVAVVRTAKVFAGPIERTIMMSGQTSSLEFQDIKAPTLRGFEAGREMILLNLIPSGTAVKKGDLLAQIDMQTLQDHIDDVYDQVQSAEADIRKRAAEQEIDRENLRQTLLVAKAELEKARLEYAASETRTPIDQELLRLAVEEAEARYKQLEADVRQKAIAHAAELKILEITRLRHVGHAQRHENDLKKYTFYSPMSGLAVVQSTWRGGEWNQVKQGDQLNSGQLFLKVVNPEKMQVEASINQVQSEELRIGQKARIGLDAFPNLKFEGNVSSIGAIATGGWRQQYYIRNIPVKVSILGSDPRLIPDLSASVEVIVERQDHAVQAPLAAIFEEDGESVVYVKNGQRTERRVVELGMKNATHVAVKSGLSEGEEVYLEKPAAKRPETPQS